MAFRYKFIGQLVKGEPDFLIYRGQFCEKMMKKHAITQADLEGICRCELQCNDLSQVEYAVIERGGKISMIRKKKDENEGQH